MEVSQLKDGRIAVNMNTAFDIYYLDVHHFHHEEVEGGGCYLLLPKELARKLKEELEKILGEGT